MKKYAVIVAGGSGLRMGTQAPKQFLLLQGKPVLWHTLNVFLDAYEDLEIILVLPEEHMETGKTILYATRAPHRIRVVAGGATRFHSVKNGLQAVERELAPGAGMAEEGRTIADGPEDAVIFVHDGVRCLLTTNLVHRCYEKAVEQGAAIPVIDSKDSVRLVTAEGNEAIDRARVKLVQTPQTFRSGILLSSYAVAYQEIFTDEATVVEASGHKVHLVEGELNNIKITTPVDLTLAGQLLILSSKG
ncbi:MAG TPA: 2-C-methyl-D-erythritol 4-phosphate cytidylyltransferase [Puia sp.]